MDMLERKGLLQQTARPTAIEAKVVDVTPPAPAEPDIWE